MSIDLRSCWSYLVGVFSIGDEVSDSYWSVIRSWNWIYIVHCRKLLSLSYQIDNSVVFVNNTIYGEILDLFSIRTCSYDSEPCFLNAFKYLNRVRFFLVNIFYMLNFLLIFHYALHNSPLICHESPKLKLLSYCKLSNTVGSSMEAIKLSVQIRNCMTLLLLMNIN